MKQYQIIKVDGQVFAREVNNFPDCNCDLYVTIRHIPCVGGGKCLRNEYNNFEQAALANKTLISNPEALPEGVEQFGEDEFEPVPEERLRVNEDYHQNDSWHPCQIVGGEYICSTGYEQRMVFKYIGKGEEKAVDKLAGAIDNAGCKVTFGLQPHHIEVIEADLNKYGNYDVLRSEMFWKDVAQKVIWSPLSLATYYLIHKQQAERTRLTSIVEEGIEYWEKSAKNYNSNPSRRMAEVLNHILELFKEVK